MSYRIVGVLILGCVVILSACNRKTTFTKMEPVDTGVDFENRVTEGVEFNFLNYLYFYNGGGVAVGDINNDGLDDLFFTSNQEANRLYLNQGDFQFEDVTESAGINHQEGSWSTGVTMADVNGDGWLDIYVSNVNYLSTRGRNQLFINNQDGTFEDKAEEFGLDFEGYSVQAAFLDYDRDNDLDMFLLNHSVHSVNTYQPVDKRKDVDPKSGDKLYRNDGGQFVDVSEEAGIFSSALGFGLGVVVTDINVDGWPDIYVGNDFHEDDYIYINQGDGTFKNRLDDFVNHTAQFTMSVDVGDINNDGKQDIATTDMLPRDEKILKESGGSDTYKVAQIKENYGYSPQFSRNMLQLNVGEKTDPVFSEIGYLAGIEATDWSWSGLLVDLDNDGYRDFYIANGIFRRPNDLDYIKYISSQQVQESLSDGVEPENLQLIQLMPELKISNYVFRNQGDLTFVNESESWGLDDESFSNGTAYSDLDNDGDLDIVVNNVNQPAFIYKNDVSSEENPPSYLSIELKGHPGNTSGIGAKVYAYSGERTFSAEQSPTRGFQSSVSHKIHFGLGETEMLDSLLVIWPNGKAQQLSDVEVNRRMVLEQSEATTDHSYEEDIPSGLFEDITEVSGIKATHSENGFVDFDNETLIPHYVSTEGPPLAVADVNGDGLEDFYMGNAKWEAGQLWLQKADGTFERSQQQAFQDDLEYEDTEAEFVDITGDGLPELIVGSGGGEREGTFEDLTDRLYLNDGEGNFRRYPRFTPMYTNTGALAVGDFDNDGDMDIFVGGRSVPRLYGFNPASYLLMNNGRGTFFDVTDILAPELRRFGMITDAKWFDHDNDGDKDLLIAGEWMPITIFENIYDEVRELEEPEPGFVNVSKASGFGSTDGWWNSIELADVNGDGQVDILAGNLGLNSNLTASEEYPVELYLNDYNRDQVGDPVVTQYKEGKRYPIATVDELVDQMSYLRKKYPTYEDYDGSTLGEIFSKDQLDSALVKQAHTFSTTLFTNNGDGSFSNMELPIQAQFSPVYDFMVSDFTGDGKEDIYLAGNFTGVRPALGDYDASYGTMLTLSIDGNWTSLPLSKVGIRLTGEVRDMEFIELASGKEGILISRNNDSLILVAQTD